MSKPIDIPNAKQCQVNHKYCKYCDHTFSTVSAFCEHMYTLKHNKNCGNIEYVRVELIRKRICQLRDGAVRKCHGLTTLYDIASQEYELGLLPVRR